MKRNPSKYRFRYNPLLRELKPAQQLTAGEATRRIVEWVVFRVLAGIGAGIEAAKRSRRWHDPQLDNPVPLPDADTDLCGIGAVTSMERDRNRRRGYGDVWLLVEVALICLLGVVLFAIVVDTWSRCGGW